MMKPTYGCGLTDGCATGVGPSLVPHGVRSLLIAATITLAFAASQAVASASAATSPGCRVRNLDTGSSFAALQEAVDAASPGEQIAVKGLCRSGTVIDKDLDIRGLDTQRWGKPILDGEGETRVLLVAKGASVTLRNVIIRRGSTEGEGAGIMNRGELRVVGGSIRGNRAESQAGGIDNRGSLTMRRTLLRGNFALGYGGAMHNSGTATLRNTVLVANEAIYGGAAVNAGTLVLSSSTVRGNEAINNGIGGGFYNFGSLRLIASKVTANVADHGGGGIWDEGGSVMLDAGSSVTGNVPDDCVGTPAC